MRKQPTKREYMQNLNDSIQPIHILIILVLFFLCLLVKRFSFMASVSSRKLIIMFRILHALSSRVYKNITVWIL